MHEILLQILKATTVGLMLFTFCVAFSFLQQGYSVKLSFLTMVLFFICSDITVRSTGSSMG